MAEGRTSSDSILKTSRSFIVPRIGQLCHFHRKNPFACHSRIFATDFQIPSHAAVSHPESKSLAPDRKPCRAVAQACCNDIRSRLRLSHLIGKETERGWEQSEDISTLLPLLIQYKRKTTANNSLRERLRKIPLDSLQEETGLSRHTILRARRGTAAPEIASDSNYGCCATTGNAGTV